MRILSLSATERLSLSTDGYIPAALWRAARAIDAANRDKRPRCSYPRLTNVTLKRPLALACMVAVILDAWARAGTVGEDDFARAGIPAAQAGALKDTAFRLAAAREPRVLEMALQP